mgnify:CR=1 FL=1
MKRFIRIVLFLLSVLILLTGCKKSTQTVSDDEMIEIDFMLSSSAAGAEKFIWNDILEKKFRLKVNFEMAAQQPHLEKVNLLVASNNLPDLVSPLPSDTAKKLGISGMLIDFNEYKESMPNFFNAIKKDPVAYASMFADDGGLYIAPQCTEEADLVAQFRYVPTLRTDLLQEVGMEVPTTYDELYQVLKAIKQKHPEVVGIINRTGTQIFNDIGFTFGARSDVHYNFEEDRFVFGPERENYKEMLKYLHKLWNENLLDPELFTASTAQFEAKLINGLGVFYMDWAGYSYRYSRAHKELLKGGEDNFILTPINPICPDIYPKRVYQLMESTNIFCSMVVSSLTEAPERIVKFIDWLYSEEGMDIAQYGIKNEHYSITPEGKYKFLNHIVADYNPGATVARDTELGINLPHMKRVITNKEHQEFDKYSLNTREALSKYAENGIGYIPANGGINLTYTEAEIEEKNAIENDITTAVNEWSIGLVTGQRSFDDYDQFIAEVKAKGVDRLVEIANTAYARFKERMNEIKNN